jgi:serine/threonine protein kinase
LLLIVFCKESDAKIVFFQMAHGVKYLHNRDIAHRDLKPENFLVRSDKSDVLVLMGDFGLARVFSGEAKFMKTLCG